MDFIRLTSPSFDRRQRLLN